MTKVEDSDGIIQYHFQATVIWKKYTDNEYMFNYFWYSDCWLFFFVSMFG